MQYDFGDRGGGDGVGADVKLMVEVALEYTLNSADLFDIYTPYKKEYGKSFETNARAVIRDVGSRFTANNYFKENTVPSANATWDLGNVKCATTADCVGCTWAELDPLTGACAPGARSGGMWRRGGSISIRWMSLSITASLGMPKRMCIGSGERAGPEAKVWLVLCMGQGIVPCWTR